MQDDKKTGDVQALTEALTEGMRAARDGPRLTADERSAIWQKLNAARAALSSLALQPVEPPTLPFRGFVRHAPSADAPRVTNFAAAPPAAVPAEPRDTMLYDEPADLTLAAVPAQPADRAEPAPLTDAKELARMWLTTHYADEHTADEIEAKCWAILGHPDEATKAGFRAFATRSQP